MRQRLGVTAASLAVVVVVFLAGVTLGSTGIVGVRPSVMTADGGYVGQQTATLTADGVAYGLHASVPWRDATGADVDRGWPACLEQSSVPQGVRFTGAVVWAGSVGQAEVLWVDCSRR